MFWKANRKKQVMEATHIECPSCETVTAVQAWNKLAVGTYGDDTPDVRKAALNKQNSFPFQCPTCFKGYSAHRLEFVKPEGKHTHLAANVTQTNVN
ncbi:hypothetical protein [Alkalicoccus luteus]|uniref:Uncharacterized protein n=1 Tax=Alkalicoccus luteus TaxID=1237094 RepID=A0A969PQ09_9BACI|nr:hypothetical protein [Alkalicoccus luteus]NJP37440.1 hypothetical protein [Alkalicoccus luteus]